MIARVEEGRGEGREQDTGIDPILVGAVIALNHVDKIISR